MTLKANMTTGFNPNFPNVSTELVLLKQRLWTNNEFTVENIGIMVWIHCTWHLSPDQMHYTHGFKCLNTCTSIDIAIWYIVAYFIRLQLNFLRVSIIGFDHGEIKHRPRDSVDKDRDRRPKLLSLLRSGGRSRQRPKSKTRVFVVSEVRAPCFTNGIGNHDQILL